jgi:hypothetical protein
MAAPQYVPDPPTDRPRSYASPDHVPEGWWPNRPAEVLERQPSGARFGYQGPDQGYGLALANRMRSEVQVTAGESVDDAVQGCLAIGLRRASMFGRAPVIHDLRIAFTVWGFLDPSPPVELLEARRAVFGGVGNPAHHYDKWRAVADRMPENTLRMSPEAVGRAYPDQWRDLVGWR